MKHRMLCTLITALCVCVFLAGCSQSAESSAKGKKSTASNARIVATTVAAAEIMDALEVDLVGVPTSQKSLPARYKGLPAVGNPMSPDMEIIQSLQPTDVLSVTTLQYDLETPFQQASVPATYLNLESLDKMENAITKLGEKYDRKTQAKRIVDDFEQKKKDIQERTKGKTKPSVLILLGVPGSYLVATENSYIGDLVRIAGGKNIVKGEKMEYLASNTEYLQKANPDIILRAAHGMPDEVVKMFDQEFKTNDIWKHFHAVKQDRVYDLEESLFGTTGNLKAAEALDELTRMLYPS
ncbi:heme ABC transporter substrate-binding protein IsdE [Bacillus altitudinis]|uniref:heme ABC transporter substrate-binding protein IsdE n=1 Tax=Bacillus altitudinis TaxID=293387 RepID=UPI0022818880|nr:heme ABC transporter substrate-binding protein IsdE [Bacillus altitudinis]MCY7453643.1 heme ABC transporter substrate-binding protein IsdE [Bacillus altitudinis]